MKAKTCFMEKVSQACDFFNSIFNFTTRYSYFTFFKSLINKKVDLFHLWGVQGHASHPPPYRPAKTRFSWARKTEHSPKPLFSLKPLDTTTWLRSLLSKVFPIMNTVLSLWLPAWWVFYWEGGGMTAYYLWGRCTILRKLRFSNPTPQFILAI